MKIPIFIINRDRITVLLKSIESYLKLKDIEIIILDNGSTYQPMLEFLNNTTYKIIRNPNPNGTFEDISEWVGESIKIYMNSNDEEYYIVTDPDIELENPEPKMLQYYIELLDNNRKAICVSPMLRIDDIPDSLTFKNQLVKSHMIQFWDDTHKRFSYKDIIYQEAWVDTTFALYRRNFKFTRLNLGIRVHEPYMAKHLDWYIDNLNLTEEQIYYINHASNVSTMSQHIKRGCME